MLATGKPAIGRPVIGKKLLKPAFAMAVPIVGVDGKVIGALIGVTNLDKPNFLAEMTDGRYGQTGGYLLLAPRHQLIVTATDKTRVMQPVPEPGKNAMYDRCLLYTSRCV